MTFPFQMLNEELQEQDFDRMRRIFAQTVREFLPGNEVFFLGVEEAQNGNDQTLPENWIKGVKLVRKQQAPVVMSADAQIFLPIWQNNILCMVAILEGCPAVLLEASTGWLMDRSRLVSRELSLLRQWSVEPVTGLLNTSHLFREIRLLIQEKRAWLQRDKKKNAVKNPLQNGSARSGQPCFTIALLEVFSRSVDAQRAIQFHSKAGAFLDSILGGYSPLHYIGAGIFGLIWEGVDEQRASMMAERVLHWLKQENYPKAHIGIATVLASDLIDDQLRGGGSKGNEDEAEEEVLANRVWLALNTARKRGPYALCTYSALSDPASHLLRPGHEATLKELRKEWRQQKKFSLILLKQDQETKLRQFPKRIQSLAGQVPFVANSGSEAFVLLKGENANQAVEWVKRFKSRVAGLELLPHGEKLTYSAGIAAYPLPGFRKADTVANARKAVVHTNFLGADTITVFDDISLNISGDVFYNEGDLAGAIKEYRKGLSLNPKNTNLLNSLGVIYAQMNRYKLAFPLFQKVLKLHKNDFMALYNLGFTCVMTGEMAAAIKYLEKALAIDDNHFGLLLQLGKLYCKTKRYHKAIELLEKGGQLASKNDVWSTNIIGGGGEVRVEGQTRNSDRGMVHRFLGEAYRGLKKYGQASNCLQRALKYNHRDTEALSLLGEIYAQSGQGDEIAISLCRQAVELDSANWLYWSRLGQVQMKTKDYASAIESFTQSLTLHRKNISDLFMLAQAYEKSGQHLRACKSYERVLKLDKGHSKAKMRFQKLSRRKIN